MEGEKTQEREKEREERRVVLGELVDYRISGRSNKMRATAKIFVSRGPIKPISASWMRVGRPRENSFDYFSANYAMGTLVTFEELSLSKLRLCWNTEMNSSEHGEKKNNVFRGFITESAVIGTDGGETTCTKRRFLSNSTLISFRETFKIEYNLIRLKCQTQGNHFSRILNYPCFTVEANAIQMVDFTKEEKLFKSDLFCY